MVYTIGLQSTQNSVSQYMHSSTCSSRTAVYNYKTAKKTEQFLLYMFFVRYPGVKRIDQNSYLQVYTTVVLVVQLCGPHMGTHMHIHDMFFACSLHVLCSTCSFCTVLQFFWCRHSVPSRFLRGIFEVSCSLNRSIFFT